MVGDIQFLIMNKPMVKTDSFYDLETLGGILLFIAA